MRIPNARLLELERDRRLRWLIPFFVTLEHGKPPPTGATLEFRTRPDRVFTCRVVEVGKLDSEIGYTGPPRPNEQMIELRQLVLGKIMGAPFP